MRVTSTPRAVTPSAKARESSGELGSHVVADDDAALAVGDDDDLGEGRADGPGDLRRELLGHEAPDVVGLDEVGEGRHGVDSSVQLSRRMRR